jgi:predicted anti-sigma-YlaC factor YlaD
MTREHLSDEALNDVLIGMGTSVSESHLAECPLCRGKVDEFQSDLGMWNAATLQWSEARAERAGRIQASRAQIRPARPRLPLAALGWALAAVALVAIAIPVGRDVGSFGAHHGTAVVAPQEDSEAQIAQDNELLKAVNAAINPDEMSPLKEYDLSGRPHPRPRRRPQ